MPSFLTSNNRHPTAEWHEQVVLNRTVPCRCWSAYQAQSGLRFDPASARYFAVWTEVRNMIACLGSLNSLLLPQVKDTALSVAGTIYIPKYEIAVLDAVMQEQRNDE